MPNSQWSCANSEIRKKKELSTSFQKLLSRLGDRGPHTCSPAQAGREVTEAGARTCSEFSDVSPHTRDGPIITIDLKVSDLKNWAILSSGFKQRK